MFLRDLHTEFISQLVSYARACGKYQDFVDRRKLLTNKLLSERSLSQQLKSSSRDVMMPLILIMMSFLISSKPIPDLMASIEA